jgi:predicted branched-subunit amino acid permease
LFRDVALVCVADGLVGVSFGATTVAGHLPWWVPIAMSLLVFAGGSQFAAVGVVLAGGSPFAAVAAGAVLNTRLLPYGFAVADVVGPPEVAAPAGADPDDPDRADSVRASRLRTSPVRTSPVRWRALMRLLGAQVITDESTAFALRQTDPARRRAAFWTCGLTLFAVWNVSVLLGVLAGSVVRNTNAFGLDATFPAVVIALALPALADLRTRFSAGTGAVLAVALTPVLPAGLPVLAALAGLSTGWRPRRRTTPHPASAGTVPHPTSARPTAPSATAGPKAHPTSAGSAAHPAGGGSTAHRTRTGSAAHPTRTGSAAHPAGAGSAAHPAGAGSKAHPTGAGSKAHPTGAGSKADPTSDRGEL